MMTRLLQILLVILLETVVIAKLDLLSWIVS